MSDRILAQHQATREHLVRQLQKILGEDFVLTELERTVFYATDVFSTGNPPCAVVAPANVEQLKAVIGLCTAEGFAVIARGGGFSYTRAYTPVGDDAVMEDMRRMDRVLEINSQDMYVTVECGCTWVALYEALKAKGLRSPYYGPLSGHRTTIGGGLSQGSFFLGSTQYGTSAESVLSLEVVLADGSVVTTGSGGGRAPASPHFRNYGPDLAGLFLQDAGALGFKTKATLKLIPWPEHTAFVTVSFEHRADAIAALSEIGRTDLTAECYIWDPVFGKKAKGATSFGDKLGYLMQVARAGRNPLAGIVAALRLAARGAGAFAGKANLLHATIDDHSRVGAEARSKRVQAIALAHGGRVGEAAAPRAMRAQPFHDFAMHAQRNAKARNVPCHGIFPHSRIQDANAAMDDVLAEKQELMQAHAVTAGVIFFAIGGQAVCIEPLLYWTDERLAHHDRLAEVSDLDALGDWAERSAAAKVVHEVRQELINRFEALGASHMQIGKAYPYRRSRQPETFALLERIKQVVDPKNRLNPGALGFPMDAAEP